MTGPTPPPAPRAAPGVDPSMEDILASIRRILSEDEAAPPPADPEPTARDLPRDDVLLLDTAMIVPVGPEVPDHKADAPAARPPIEQPLHGQATTASAAGVPEPGGEEDDNNHNNDEDDNDTEPAPMAASAAAVAASPIDKLVRTLAADRAAPVRHGGPTIEDLVREEIRPLLKDWLNRHLPALVEAAVRTEVERVVGRGTR
jgi:uncharacterized protein